MTIASPRPQDILPAIRDAARAAGRTALPFFRSGAKTSARISYKEFGSPVTEADLAADRVIRDHLERHWPMIPILSEEAADDVRRAKARHVFVVDPIDGTRAFIDGTTEWCVSIGLLEDGQPAAGAIYAPARDELFVASLGQGAFLNDRRLMPAPPNPAALRIGGPMPVLNQMQGRIPGAVAGAHCRALAYRLASVAAGTIDVALAGSGAHDWDIVAAAIILKEAGLDLLTGIVREPVYNAADPVHPALIAAPRELALRLIPFLQRYAA